MTERGSRLLRQSICLYWIIVSLWLTKVILQELDRKIYTEEFLPYGDMGFTKPFLLQELIEWSQPLILDIKILEKGIRCDQPAFMRTEGGSKEYEARMVFEGEQAELTSVQKFQTNKAGPEETHEESAPQDLTDSSNGGALQNGDAAQNQTNSPDLGTKETAGQQDLALIAYLTEKIETLQQDQDAIRIQFENSDSAENLVDQIEALQYVITQTSEQLTALQTSNHTDQEKDENTSNEDKNTTEDATKVTTIAEEQTVKATQPITASNFKNGTTICLTRSDQFSAYRRFVTVDLSTQTCPSGYEPCSKLTDPANTLCVKPGMQSLFCPITDIKVIQKSRIAEQLSPEEARIYEQAEFSGNDDNLDWALFYSREYNGLPLVSFVLERQKPCFSQAERRGDPQRDILDIGTTVYKQGCEDEYSGLVDDRYRSVSDGLTFTEGEWFKDAGIWAAYETLPGKREEVERLKQRKSETQLLLWAKPVPAYSLECRDRISDLNSFASLIQTDVDAEEGRFDLFFRIDDLNNFAIGIAYVPLFWFIFVSQAAVIIGQFMCMTCFCHIKYKRYPEKERQRIQKCYKGDREGRQPCMEVLGSLMVFNNLGQALIEVTVLSLAIEHTSNPYFDRENTILKYAQCSDKFLELAIDRYVRPASIAPPVPEFGLREILSIVVGLSIMPIWMKLFKVHHSLVWEQWALIDRDFPRGQARTAQIEAVQLARDEESKELIEDGDITRDPISSAGASASVSPEQQSNHRAADGSGAKKLNPQSVEASMKDHQD